MNQILITSYNEDIFCQHRLCAKPKIKKYYLFIFLISISICALLLTYLFVSHFLKLKQMETTNMIKNKYNITALYSSTASNHEAINLSNEISIIGLIEIPTIKLSYPIFANTNHSLLKISVCRFSGPMPNRNGNLCIAGHNYQNSLMFSKLDQLNINDSIYITDLNNVKLEYIIYGKFKIKENNLECTANTSDPEITLITCNEYNNKERIVIKAKVKE